MSDTLKVRNLEASYGAFKVLHGLDFDIAEGSVTTLLGANGAGKTTTLRALCGMIRRSGTIEFEGRSIANMKTEDIVRLGVAHVPEGRGTFTSLTVEENLRLGAMTRRAGEEVGRRHAVRPRGHRLVEHTQHRRPRAVPVGHHASQSATLRILQSPLRDACHRR